MSTSTLALVISNARKLINKIPPSHYAALCVIWLINSVSFCIVVGLSIYSHTFLGFVPHRIDALCSILATVYTWASHAFFILFLLTTGPAVFKIFNKDQ